MTIEAKVYVSPAYGLRAILLAQFPSPEQVEALRMIGGPGFRGDPVLARRWGYAAVYCHTDFSGSVMARKEQPPELWDMVVSF